MRCCGSPVLLVSDGDAVDKFVWQGRRRGHVNWWEHSIGAVARRCLPGSHTRILVTVAVGLCCMIRRVEAGVKDLPSYRMSD